MIKKKINLLQQPAVSTEPEMMIASGQRAQSDERQAVVKEVGGLNLLWQRWV